MPRPVLHSPGVLPTLSAFGWTAALLLSGGCGDKSTAPPPPPSGGSITVAPGNTTVIAGDTLLLAASSQNLAGADVTWSVARLSPTPSNAELGAVTTTGPTTAVYTAPGRVEGPFDYRVQIIARSVADTTITGSIVVTVPRVAVLVRPGSVGSVLPGTLVPYEVTVLNALDAGFRLSVDGVRGGNDQLGTWTQTGPISAVYQAPQALETTTTFNLIAHSTQDSTHFGTAIVTVRRGFGLPETPEGQYAPAWRPGTSELAYVRGGPPWEVMVWDPLAGTSRPLVSFSWTAADYDGQLDWSSDGTHLAFSEEEAGGRRVIGIVDADGGGRATFSPDPAASYLEAAFLPQVAPGNPESLLVSGGSGAPLRAFPLTYVAGEQGRPVHSPGGGVSARWPDAALIALAGGGSATFMICEESDGGVSEVVVFGGTMAEPLTVAQGPGRRTHVRWGQQTVGGQGLQSWITYVWDGNQTSYRVSRQGFPAAIRLYSEFFPELAGDLSIALGFDAHALSRRPPTGPPRIWVVEFPPYDFTGVPKPEEEELAAMGIRGALSPSGWRRWLGTYDPRARGGL